MMTASSIQGRLDRLVIFANPKPKWLQIKNIYPDFNYMI